MISMKTIENVLPKQILSQFNTLEMQMRALEEQNKNAIIEIEMKMFEFMYSVLIPEKQRKETVKEVEEIRQKSWKEALKKAKGNKEKAFEIWAGSSS